MMRIGLTVLTGVLLLAGRAVSVPTGLKSDVASTEGQDWAMDDLLNYQPHAHVCPPSNSEPLGNNLPTRSAGKGKTLAEPTEGSPQNLNEQYPAEQAELLASTPSVDDQRRPATIVRKGRKGGLERIRGKGKKKGNGHESEGGTSTLSAQGSTKSSAEERTRESTQARRKGRVTSQEKGKEALPLFIQRYGTSKAKFMDVSATCSALLFVTSHSQGTHLYVSTAKKIRQSISQENP